MILAAACFARSSPKFRDRLLNNRIAGPYLVQWRDERTVPRAAKRKAYGLATLSFAISIAIVDRLELRIGLAVLCVLLLLFLRALPTAPDSRAGE